MTDKPKNEGKDDEVTPMAEGAERSELEVRIENLRRLAMPSSDLAADVYQDVLDGKVALEDADAEMAARSSA